MKYFNHLHKVLLGFYLCTALVANSATPASATKDELIAQKDLLQIQIDSEKELLHKDIESQNTRIDSVDQRIDDQAIRIGDIGSSVNLFGIIVGVMGTFITVFLVVVGLWGYKAARRDAEQTAKDTSQKWFDENNKSLNARLEELERRALDAIKNIDNHEQSVKEISDFVKVEIQTMQTNIGQEISNKKLAIFQAISSSAVEQRAEELKKYPEDSYSFDDWNTRAFAAYKENKNEEAIFYWNKATEMPAAGAKNSAQALFNKGNTLVKIGRKSEGEQAYEKIISIYIEDRSSDIQEIVILAMLTKYNLFLEDYFYKEAIEGYNSIITKFGNNSVWLNYIERAKSNKGFALLCEAKRTWQQSEKLRINLLEEAEQCLLVAVEKFPHDGFVFGNLAYTKWLLKNEVEAEKYFFTGLEAIQYGGEQLYNGTLEDIARDPVEMDKGFKSLVEKLWAEFQKSKTS